MRQRQVVLIGSIVGVFFTSIAQYVLPLNSSLLSSAFFSSFLDPEGVVVVYLTIPLVIGCVTGLVDRKQSGENGLISGLITGVVNHIITSNYLGQFSTSLLPTNPQLLSQFNFFTVMLALLWALLAGFSARATAWSLENPSIEPGKKVPSDAPKEL